MEQKLDGIPEIAANCNLNYLPCATLNIYELPLSPTSFSSQILRILSCGRLQAHPPSCPVIHKGTSWQGVRGGKRLIVNLTTHRHLKTQKKECMELSIRTYFFIFLCLIYKNRQALRATIPSLDKLQTRATRITTFNNFFSLAVTDISCSLPEQFPSSPNRNTSIPISLIETLKILLFNRAYCRV